MSMRDRMYELTAVEEVDEFLKQFPIGAFFKAGSCHKTMQGFGYVEQALNLRPNIHVGFVKVVECRPVSNYIAQLMGVVHQSPQLIIYINGKAVYDVDNWNITPQALEIGLNNALGPVQSHSATAPAKNLPDVTPYVQLIEKLLKGQLSETDFRQQWLFTFQQDATARPNEQFELLNSLYGDVDVAIHQPTLGVVPEKSPLREKARNLLNKMKNDQ